MEELELELELLEDELELLDELELDELELDDELEFDDEPPPQAVRTSTADSTKALPRPIVSRLISCDMNFPLVVGLPGNTAFLTRRCMVFVRVDSTKSILPRRAGKGKV